MFTPRFNALRARLDALTTGEVAPAGVIGRARAIFARPGREVRLPVLTALDQALDRAGVHTSADAKLLYELGAVKGRLAALKDGLLERAAVALTEYETGLAAAELFASLAERDATQVSMLEAYFCKLARVVNAFSLRAGFSVTVTETN